MKLNWDCFYDVLETLEEVQEIETEEVRDDFDDDDIDYIFDRQIFSIHEIAGIMMKYSPVDVFYAAYNLYQGGYINGKFEIMDNKTFTCPYIKSITLKGHRLLRDRRMYYGTTDEQTAERTDENE